jgi:hypothetical protein
MQIPYESTRPSTHHKKSSSTSAFPEPSESPVPNTFAGLSSAAVFEASPDADPLDMTVFATPPKTDPDDVVDTAVWYIQPPTASQFGPTTSDVIQDWLAQGRLTADCLLWREGWNEWRQADDVFPQLAAKLSIPALEALFGKKAHEPVSGRAGGSRASFKKLQWIAWSMLFALLLILSITSLVMSMQHSPQ